MREIVIFRNQYLELSFFAIDTSDLYSTTGRTRTLSTLCCSFLAAVLQHDVGCGKGFKKWSGVPKDFI
jgi:hypothetical protein